MTKAKTARAAHFFCTGSGLSLADCYVIAARREVRTRAQRRTRNPDDPPMQQKHVVRIERDTLRVVSKPASFEDVLAMPGGTVYAATGGAVYRSDAPAPGGWRPTLTDGPVDRLVALGEQGIAAYSVRGPGTIWRHDGRSWDRIPVPEGCAGIAAIGGRSLDDLFLVGAPDLLRRWDGASWREVPWHRLDPQPGPRYPPTFTGVYVGADGLVTAVRNRSEIYQGDGRGLEQVACISPENDGQLCGVATWRGRIWSGHLMGWVLSFAAGKSTTAWLAPPRSATQRGEGMFGFDARGDLLITTSYDLVGTGDGENFSAIDHRTLAAAVGDEDLPWSRGDGHTPR